jgi:enamine deaminase RidA (YjgF/YER057c/UK114 family)
MGHQARLRDLGLELPFAPVPAGSYGPATQTGNLIFTAGQLPSRDGELHRTGKVGAAVMLEEAQGAAGPCALNAMVAAEKAGGLDNLRDVVKVTGFVELPLDAPVEVEVVFGLDTPA